MKNLLKKDLFKIGALGIALIASLLLLCNVNITYAAPGLNTGSLSLIVIAGSADTCQWGNTLALGSIAVSSTTGVLNATFTSPADFNCDDLQFNSRASWAMTLQSDDLVNPAFPTDIIGSGNITMKTDLPTMPGGSCTMGGSTTSYTPIDTAQTIVAKASAAGQVCKIEAINVMIEVTVPPYRPLGTYTANLTLDSPF